MRVLICLDIDGVLNHWHWFKTFSHRMLRDASNRVYKAHGYNRSQFHHDISHLCPWHVYSRLDSEGFGPEQVEEAIEKARELPLAAPTLDYETFEHFVEGLDEWAAAQGYDDDLPLEGDWHVSYHRSVYDGRECFYLCWSGI